MNVSQNKLNEYIELYLNDVEDYSDEKTYILTESILTTLKSLIVESKKDMSLVLKEALINTTPEKREVIKDFMLYIEEAQVTWLTKSSFIYLIKNKSYGKYN